LFNTSPAIPSAPGNATAVSAANTHAPGRRAHIHAAFNAALCNTIARGSAAPSSCSTTRASITSNLTPSNPKSSRRRGDAEANTSKPTECLLETSFIAAIHVFTFYALLDKVNGKDWIQNILKPSKCRLIRLPAILCIRMEENSFSRACYPSV
jgi:hypothetical protein